MPKASNHHQGNMPMRLLAIIPAAAAILMAAPVPAQIGNPAGVEAGTQQAVPGTPAPHETNNTDQLFARLAAIGGKAEVDLGQLAQQKGTDPAVKEFARMMVQDHSKANDKLMELASAANIPLPTGFDPDHQALRDKHEKLSGADFDVAYMLGQIEEHQKTVLLLQWEIGSGQNAPLQKFAAETLSTVVAHLRRAQFIASELTGQTPPEIAPRMSSTSDQQRGAPGR
jgi:putative membrane protein